MAKDENLDVFKNAPEETASVTSGRKLRIGFIGTGGIANSHMKAYKQFDDVEVVAGADLIEGKAADFFAKYDLPNVKCYTDYKQMLEEASECSLKLFMYETGDRISMQEAIRAALPCGTAAIITGPEGGFTAEEAELARSKGFAVCAMGPRILRCETAPLIPLTAILYESGDLN